MIPKFNKHFIFQLIKRLKQVLDLTTFKNACFVSVAVSPADESPIGIDELINIMKEETYIPVRNRDGPFFMAVDHCFNVSGRGTVLTGTIIQGQVKVKDVRI